MHFLFQESEQDYLKRKWRENVADMSTGLDAASLKADIEANSAEWGKEGDFQIVKARALEYLCENTAIDISEKDWFPAFAYWTRHTFDVHPTWDLIHNRSKEISEAKCPGLKWGGDGWWMYLDFDHSAPDWDDALKIGFTGMKLRLLANWKDDDFHRARLIAADAIGRLLDRLIAQCEKSLELRAKSLDVDVQCSVFSVQSDGTEGGRACRPAPLADGVNRTSHIAHNALSRISKVVDSLKRLKAGAPETTLDVLEFIYLYFVISENFEAIQVRTLGNLDRLLTPYYRADLAAGRITEDEFRDMISHFWWQWGSMDNYWGQPVYFGGTKADGTTEYNEVSRILMEVHDELALPTPKVHLKIGKSTPDWFWRQSLEMMRKQRSLTFIGEEPHWRVIRKYGYTEEQARTFLVWGCYEWALKDSANDTCGGCVSMVRPLVRMLDEVSAGTLVLNDFESFKHEYLARIERRVIEARDGMFMLQTCLPDVNPSLLFSLATPYSIVSGKDAFSGGMRYGNNTGIWMIGLGTAVDSLVAVKELVYEANSLELRAKGLEIDVQCSELSVQSDAPECGRACRSATAAEVAQEPESPRAREPGAREPGATSTKSRAQGIEPGILNELTSNVECQTLSSRSLTISPSHRLTNDNSALRTPNSALQELAELLKKDWEGAEDLRLRMKRSKRKWGNNDPEANSLAREISKRISPLVNGVPNSRGGFFKISGHSARNHYDFGAKEQATPDGRHSGDEFSKNIAATMGADTEGATALLGSYATLDPIDFPGDFPCDMALLPATIKGEKGLLLMRALIERYFANNGLVIHFNVVGADTLKDAQKHPEKYENLQVRVCGWNVRWNNIPKKEQDAFILRQERLNS